MSVTESNLDDNKILRELIHARHAIGGDASLSISVGRGKLEITTQRTVLGRKYIKQLEIESMYVLAGPHPSMLDEFVDSVKDDIRNLLKGK